MTARGADSDHRISACFFPSNNHGMFSSCSTDKKFISLLALSHVFLFFIRKYVIFLLLATLLDSTAKSPEAFKEMHIP